MVSFLLHIHRYKMFSLSLRFQRLKFNEVFNKERWTLMAFNFFFFFGIFTFKAALLIREYFIDKNKGRFCVQINTKQTADSWTFEKKSGRNSFRGGIYQLQSVTYWDIDFYFHISLKAIVKILISVTVYGFKLWLGTMICFHRTFWEIQFVFIQMKITE